ncbi:AAA domain-containing protein, partial [Bacillus cereus group sp. BceL310]
LCNIHASAEYSFDSLEKQISSMIKTAQVNDDFDDIDDEKWQSSQKQFVNIDGDNKEDRINCVRSKLFKTMMDEYCTFLIENQDKIEKNLTLARAYFLGGKEKTNLDSQINEKQREDFIQAMFDTIFLLTPIISSTFASVSRFLRDLKTEDIGWLFIDEAGQATPQSAIGAIWRSRNVVVVGDPLQIPPVVTLSDDQLKLIANESAGITSESSFFYHLTRSEVSVQEFADLNNK